jgi:hypothetical protein
MGDVREDGYVFLSYSLKKLKNDGTFAEEWQDPAKSFRSRVRTTAYHARVRSKELGIPFDIDVDYLLSIYPEGGLCPILKTPLVFGGSRWNSPSLDRRIPSLGYVRGNVCWISDKANTLKQDITDPSVFLAIAEYVSGCTTQHTSNLNNG